MENRAFREGWRIPQSKRDEIGDRLIGVVTGPRRYKIKYVVAAAKGLMSADLRQQEIDLKKAEPALKLNDAIDEALDAPGEAEGDPA